jgi:hypothetical protein
MATYGRQVLAKTGTLVQVAAGPDVDWKTGGVTIDWAGITAVTEDTTYADGTLVPDGAKALPLGTVLFKNTGTGTYEPATNDTTLVNGQTFILNETVLEHNTNPLVGLPTDHPAVIAGGRVFRDRVLAGGSGQPSWDSVLDAMPRLLLVSNDEAEG